MQLKHAFQGTSYPAARITFYVSSRMPYDADATYLPIAYKVNRRCPKYALEPQSLGSATSSIRCQSPRRPRRTQVRTLNR
jgi:hypothetical protein